MAYKKHHFTRVSKNKGRENAKNPKKKPTNVWPAHTVKVYPS